MKYLIFKKRNDLSMKPDWYDPVITKSEYQTTEYDLAQIRYDKMLSKLRYDEVLFLVADFGLSHERKIFQITYPDFDKNYLPYFVIKCSNDSYFNYEETFNITNVKVVLIQNGIHQIFFDPDKAFEKYDYYRNYRIDATMAIEYTNENNQINIIPVSCIKEVLFEERNNYIQRLGFEPMPGHHRVGPFWIKDKETKDQVEV